MFATGEGDPSKSCGSCSASADVLIMLMTSYSMQSSDVIWQIIGEKQKQQGTQNNPLWHAGLDVYPPQASPACSW